MSPIHRLHASSPVELQARLEAERRGTPFLILRDGDDRQLLVTLDAARSPLTIGRQEASHLALTWDPEVSRAHADIDCIGDVWMLVEDGRSRNGCYVNGTRVHGRRPLRHGDVIRVGHTALTFVAPLASGDDVSTAAGAAREPPPVSPAQRRVLVAICRPLAEARFAPVPSNRQLAEELCLSTETVKFHLHALFERFAITGVPQHSKRLTLALLALELGVVSPHELQEPHRPHEERG